MATPPTPVGGQDSSGNVVALKVSSAGALAVDTSDIQIGAVEIKNATDDTRATVGANGLHVDVRSPSPAGTLVNGAQVAVAGPEDQILAANANRKVAIIQNVGGQSVRVGVTGVTATTGIKVGAGEMLILEAPYCPTAALFAIEDSGASTVYAGEVTG